MAADPEKSVDYCGSRRSTTMGQQHHERWIAEENIARFERRLKRENNPEQRQMLTALLARERTKLQEKANRLASFWRWSLALKLSPGHGFLINRNHAGQN